MQLSNEKCLLLAHGLAKLSLNTGCPVEILVDCTMVLTNEKKAGKSVEDCNKAAIQYLRKALADTNLTDSHREISFSSKEEAV